MTDQEWFNGLTTEEAKEQRLIVRAWFVRLIFILILGGITIWATKAYSAPIYEAKDETLLIVLTDEPCNLPEVSNLKHRATWTEKGKTFQGCYAIHPAVPFVLAYFEDKTVVLVPAEVFQRVPGA
jgi:hypothetical protein